MQKHTKMFPISKFAFCCLCILSFCILSHLYFVIFVFCFMCIMLLCILSKLFFGIILFCFICIFKLWQGASSTRFAGWSFSLSVRTSKNWKSVNHQYYAKRSVQFSWVNHIRGIGGGVGGGWRGGGGEGYRSICNETICTGISKLHHNLVCRSVSLSVHLAIGLSVKKKFTAGNWTFF